MEESRAGLRAIVWGSLVSAGFAVVVATRLFASDVKSYFRVGSGVSGFDFALSMALFAVGHLVGLWVGVAMLLGALIGWGWGVPHFSALAAGLAGRGRHRRRDLESSVRFLGAGTIGVAAIWTLLKLVKPVWNGLASAMAASKVRARPASSIRCRAPNTTSPSALSALITGELRADRLAVQSPRQRQRPRRADVALVIGGLLYCVVMSFPRLRGVRLRPA